MSQMISKRSRTLWWRSTRDWFQQPHRLRRFRAEYQLTTDGMRANRMHFLAAAVELGALGALDESPCTTDELARALDLPDPDLVEAFLRAGAACGQLHVDRAGRWRLRGVQARMLATPPAVGIRGRIEETHRYDGAVLPYLADHLRGAPPGQYLPGASTAIARGSRSVEACLRPLVHMVAADRPARRVLDVGCGDATYLSEALAALPDACGVGVELDGRVVELACKVIAERGLSERAEVFEGDICGVDLDGSFDLVLCLQVIYYIPESDRPSLFARLRALLRPGGTLVLAFLGRGNDPTATHYDLIFRMTAGLSRLPDPSVIAEQLTAAGFASTELLSLLPGQPLYGVVAEVPS